jgi:hypothetical protein
MRPCPGVGCHENGITDARTVLWSAIGWVIVRVPCEANPSFMGDMEVDFTPEVSSKVGGFSSKLISGPGFLLGIAWHSLLCLIQRVPLDETRPGF